MSFCYFEFDNGVYTSSLTGKVTPLWIE